MMQMNNTEHADTIDHDLHGLVGVRLVNPAARHAAVVANQHGPLQTGGTNRILPFVSWRNWKGNNLCVCLAWIMLTFRMTVFSFCIANARRLPKTELPLTGSAHDTAKFNMKAGCGRCRREFGGSDFGHRNALALITTENAEKEKIIQNRKGVNLNYSLALRCG